MSAFVCHATILTIVRISIITFSVPYTDFVLVSGRRTGAANVPARCVVRLKKIKRFLRVANGGERIISPDGGTSAAGSRARVRIASVYRCSATISWYHTHAAHSPETREIGIEEFALCHSRRARARACVRSGNAPAGDVRGQEWRTIAYTEHAVADPAQRCIRSTRTKISVRAFMTTSSRAENRTGLAHGNGGYGCLRCVWHATERFRIGFRSETLISGNNAVLRHKSCTPPGTRGIRNDITGARLSRVRPRP